MSIFHVNSVEEFDTILKEKDHLVVDFYADWCGPCRMLAPVLEELSSQKALGWKTQIVKVDVDKFQDLALKYNVSSLPTVVFLNNKKEKDRLIGFRPKEVLVEKAKESFQLL